MKQSIKTKGYTKSKPRSVGRLKMRLGYPAKKLSDLVNVYEDLEKTLRGLKANALLHSGNSLREINIQKLITQLSKSKRRIERKISTTLVSEKAQMRSQFNKWAPKLKAKIGKDKVSQRTQRSI